MTRALDTHGGGAQIVSLGYYLPSRTVTNAELTRTLDTSDAWIRRRVGVTTRHLADDEDIESMASAAARMALANSGLRPAEVDLVIVATSTASHAMPNLATRVAAALGLDCPAAFDVNSACSGFISALANANHAIMANAAEHALVVAADKPSAVVDWSDRSTCVFVGDGAGAAVLSRASEPGIGPVAWGSTPELNYLIRIDNDGIFRQEGPAVFRWVLTSVADVARRACKLADVPPADLAAFVPHQANLRLIEALAKQLAVTRAVVATDVVDSGNTFAASIPLSLARLAERGEVLSGDLVLLLGFGAGLTYAGQVVRCP